MWKLYSVDLGLFLLWGLATCIGDLNRFQVFRGNSSVIVCFSRIELNLLNSNLKWVSCRVYIQILLVYIQVLLLVKNKCISNILFVLVLLSLLLLVFQTKSHLLFGNQNAILLKNH